MNKKQIKENGFEGAGASTAGALNYGQSYGTFGSPEVSQNPAQFPNSNKNKDDKNKSLGNTSNTAKDVPKAGQIQRDINAIYSKKKTPSVDSIVTGIKYEMGQQIKKDKAMAKQEVLKNLKKNPDYYSGLHMLNITDKDMVDNMQESKHPNDAAARTKITPNIDATKQIFAEMSKGRDNKYVVNSQICDVMKEMWAAKTARSAWKSNPKTP